MAQCGSLIKTAEITPMTECSILSKAAEITPVTECSISNVAEITPVTECSISNAAEITPVTECSITNAAEITPMTECSSQITENTSPTLLKHLILQFAKSPLERIQYLQKMGLLSKEYSCPKCHNSMKLAETKSITDGYRWVCRKRFKGQQHDINRSIRRGTWFDKSRMPLEQIMEIAYMWVFNFPQCIVRRELQIGSKHTTADWYSFCREICVDSVIARSQPIGGPGKIVEIDESKFGSNKCRSGTYKRGVWVFGGVERDSDKCFLDVVLDHSSDTLLTVIKEKILPGSKIYSDCWKSYNCLTKKGFVNLKNSHSLEFIDYEAGCSAKTMEKMWQHVKLTLTRSSVDDMFFGYLAEFMYKKRLKNIADPFLEFIADIKALYPPAVHDEQE